MTEKLALFGGPRTMEKSPGPYQPYGKEEVQAAMKVVESGVLSEFYGSWDRKFYGGANVQEFEKSWAIDFGVKHAVSVNSATSGLIAAVGAIGIEPGDEVIVSPWTMSASATAILVWNAIPVFADIETDSFNLDPKSVEACITPETKGIVISDIFGRAGNLDAVMEIARGHGLKVVEDAAQSPGARYKGRHVGTIADIGVFSLNYHKHIHTGEGGMCTTDDSELCEKLQLIRNHAEAVVADKGATDLTNMIGFNFRMGEVEAAIGVEQLKKLEELVGDKRRLAARLSKGLSGLTGLRTPDVRCADCPNSSDCGNCSHVYYVYAIVIEPHVLQIPRAKIVAALEAEGVPGLMAGYLNLHEFPLFRKKMAYGRKGFPWVGGPYSGNVSYEHGICPVAEDLHQSSMIGLQLCLFDYSDADIDSIVEAFRKVWRNIDHLR